MRAVITEDLIRRKRQQPGEVWDTKLPGLVLRVRESGTASYVVVYGRGKKHTLGRADVLSPTKARVLAQGVLGDVAHGKDPQAERRKRRAGSLDEFLEEHYGPWAAANLKTGEETVDRVRQTFPAAMRTRSIADLSAFHVEQWRTRRRQHGIADSTINRDLDALRMVLSKAVEWNVIADHPMDVVRRAKVDKLGRVRFLTAKQEQRLRATLIARDETRRARRQTFNAWRGERKYRQTPEYGTYTDHLTPIILLSMNLGLRRGEMLALRWYDVDLVAAQLTVRGTSAKTGLSRHLPLNSEAVTVLSTWRRCVELEQGAVAADGVVFAGPDGEPMFSLKTAWQKIAIAAGLKDFTFHDLRHHFASRLVQAGVDLNTVRELLGHSDIKMTLRYAHLAPEHKAAAVATLVRA